MGPLSRLQALARRLPLGEGRSQPEEAQRSPDREIMKRLARALDSDEVIDWAGWVYAGRGVPPDQTLDEAAAVVTDRRVAWCASGPDAEPDHELFADLLPLRLDKHTKRLLLRTQTHDEDHPELAVLWSFAMEQLVEGIAARLPDHLDEPEDTDPRPDAEPDDSL